MLKCEGGCQRMVNEYYVMPDDKIFCYDCWRYGKERMENQQKNNWRDYQSKKERYDEVRRQIEIQIEELTDRINREKNADIEYLERQRWNLYQQRASYKEPHIHFFLDAWKYYNEAKYISASESQFYETVTLPARRAVLAQKAEKERKRREAEADKQRKEAEKRKAEAEKQRLNEIESKKKREATEMKKLKQSAKIDAVWIEHNIIQNNQKGMKIHVKFHIFNMLSLLGEIVAYFYTKPGFWKVAKPLKDENNSYCSMDGQVSVGSTFIPSYQNCVYSDYELFIPYPELHQPKGRHDLTFSIEIFSYNKKSLTRYWDKKGFGLENN